jgi:Winged helix DNA-binding domain
MADAPGAAVLLAARACSQWLTDRHGQTVAAVAAHTAGLQAQDTPAARLAVRARSRRLTAQAVRRACAEQRSVVRTWLMRGTLHMVAAEDVRWMLALFGPRNIAGSARRRRDLGLDDRTCARALAEIPKVLAEESPLPRASLVDRLVQRGVAVDQRGQAPAHLVGYAAAHGLICRGPDLDGDEPGYVLLDDWLPADTRPAADGGTDEEAALAELARRYVGGYGPATAGDMAAWSGLPAGLCRHALGLVSDDVSELAGGTYVLAGHDHQPTGGDPVLRLVGAFDAYLLGYRSRQPALDHRYAKRIQAGGGIIHPAVLVDGRVVGTWRLRRDRSPATVTIEQFLPLERALLPALAAEATDLGRFLGIEVSETVVAATSANRGR